MMMRTRRLGLASLCNLFPVLCLFSPGETFLFFKETLFLCLFSIGCSPMHDYTTTGLCLSLIHVCFHLLALF